MIEPFKIAIDPRDIDDLKQRIERARWPSKIDGNSWTLGMDAAYLAAISDYWARRYDWQRAESDLNSVPNFRAVTDTGAIHFVQLKGQPNALPIVLTHGWPSTFAELLTLGDMLANPARHGASPADSFDVVIPSLPGYIFSSPPTAFGTNLFTIAEQWSDLMQALGYPRFLAHGGDFGAGVSTALGLRHEEHVLGIHLNYIPGSYQPHPPPQGSELSPDEAAYLARRDEWYDREGGYSHVQATKPDVLGPALNDSPVGLAAWILDKFRSWSDCNGDLNTRFTYDQLLTTLSLYWFTRSMPSAIRLYWEGRQHPLRFAAGERVRVPVGVAHFPREIPLPPRRYVERGFNVTRWTEMPKGGHFAAMEEPAALADDIRAFARPLRRFL